MLAVPASELFLVLEPLSPAFDEVFAAIAPLGELPTAALLRVDIYYRSETDVALLGLRFDPDAFAAGVRHQTLRSASSIGLSVLEPSQLDEHDRRTFFDLYLAEYDIRLQDCGSAPEALAELGIALGLVSPLEDASTCQRMLKADVGAEADSPTAGVLVQPPGALLTHTVFPSTTPAPVTRETRRLGSISPSEPSPDASLLQNVPAAPTDAALPPREGAAGSSARTGTLIGRRDDGLRPPPSPAFSDPGRIDVRFLRGGQWVPARLRSLSARGAYLVTGAPPRLADAVHVALGFGQWGAMVRGLVHHVTTAEDAATTGSSGFAVRFPQDDTPARRQLIELLRRAREAGVTIKPPPPRGAVRFPVLWPIRVGSGAAGFAADALDLSASGMFLAASRVLDDRELRFRLPLENGDAPICGCARIMRHLDDEAAAERGLRSGFGVHIVELGGRDERRYRELLDRIRRRTDKCVVVGASAEYLNALVDGLTAVGYSVTASSDPGVLVRLADLEPRGPDVAIIDKSMSSHGLQGDWLEQVFTSRDVPCVTVGGQPMTRTRAVIDGLLRVS